MEPHELTSQDSAASPAVATPVQPPTLPVVQRVPRKVLLIFGAVAAFFLWAAAFLTAPPKTPMAQPPRPPASEEDELRRRDLKNFLDETRQQATAIPPATFPPSTAAPTSVGNDPAASYPSSPPYEFPTSGASGPAVPYQHSPEPAAPAPDPLNQALRSPLVPPAFKTTAALSESSSRVPSAAPWPAEFAFQALGAQSASDSLAKNPPPTALAPGRPVSSTSPAASYDLTTLADRLPAQQILRKGTVIPAILESAINSDLPGQVTALVARDVYDTATASRVLIPQGTRLVGRFDATPSYGQRRLFVLWTDLVTPSGRRYQLPDFPGADAAGAPGLSGRTNHHSVRLFTGALLLSLVSAGAQLSQPEAYGGITYRSPTAGEVAAGALGQRLGDVSSGLIDRELKVPPTIVIPAGTRFVVPLTADVLFPIPSKEAS